MYIVHWEIEALTIMKQILIGILLKWEVKLPINLEMAL